MAKKQFNDASLKRLTAVIQDLPGLEESLKKHKISLQDLDEVSVFGYGSLPDQPHYPPDSIEDAYLWGYSRDMCCLSVRSGTEALPGLTLGLDKNKTGIVPGAILTYKNTDIEKLAEMLEAFAAREVVKELPIYKFEFLEIEKQNGQKSMAIVCVADPDSAGYFGSPSTPLEQFNLSHSERDHDALHKKAIRIANANGFLKKSKVYSTCKSYFDRFVRIPIEENRIIVDTIQLKNMSEHERTRYISLYQEQERMLKLAALVDVYREDMRQKRPKLVQILEEAERNQMKLWREKKAEASKKRRSSASLKKSKHSRKR